MIKEADIQKQIIGWLRLNGHYCQKIQSGMLPATYKGTDRKIKLADAGTPDIMACIKGHFVAIEVKRDEKTVNSWLTVVAKYERGEIMGKSHQAIINQYLTAEKIIASGGFYCVVASVEDLEKDLISRDLITNTRWT